MKDKIEAAIATAGFKIGTTGDPNAGWPTVEGSVTSVIPDYSFGDGISAVAVTPTFVQKCLRSYPWGHTSWHACGSRVPYASVEELTKALTETARLKKGTTLALTLPTFPGRPINGGPLEQAHPKTGTWAVEPKVNGWRTLIHVPTATMWNRHGAKLSIAHEFETALEILRDKLPLAGSFEWADCEALERRHGIGRGALIVLDAIPLDPLDRASYAVRRDCLTSAFECFIRPQLYAPDEVTLIPSFPSEQATDLYALLATMNREASAEFYEGVVMKRIDSAYPAQLLSSTRETTDWVKHRWAF